MRDVHLEGVEEDRLARDDRLNHNVFDPSEQALIVHKVLAEDLAQRLEAPLRAVRFIFGRVARDRAIMILLIDRVVRQVHVFILLVYLLGVRLGRKASETLLVHINTQRLIAGDNDIDAQVELVTVNKQGIGDVLGDYASFIDVHIIDVVDDVDAASLARIGGFHNPHILLRFVLLQLLIVVVKVTELVWQDVGVGAEVKCRLAEALLESDNVEAETVLAGDLVGLREVVNLLVFIEALILVALA